MISKTRLVPLYGIVRTCTSATQICPKSEWDTGVSELWAFNLDHFLPVLLILSKHLSIFLPSYWGFLFLITAERGRKGKRLKMGKRGCRGLPGIELPPRRRLHMMCAHVACSTWSNMISDWNFIFDHIIFEHNMVNDYVRIWLAPLHPPCNKKMDKLWVEFHP